MGCPRNSKEISLVCNDHNGAGREADLITVMAL